MKKILYGISSFTGGLIGTILGFFTGLFFKCVTKHKTHSGKGSFLTDGYPLTKNCGFSIGIFTFIDGTNSEYMNNHEFGHCVQNAIGGPFVLFLNLASMINFGYCEIIGDFSSHDKMWVERNATELGNKKG